MIRRKTVGDLELSSSDEKYHLDGAVLMYMYENSPTMNDAIKSLVSPLRTASENAKIQTGFLSEIRKYIEEDVASYIKATSDNTDCDKYKQLKSSIKELLT